MVVMDISPGIKVLLNHIYIYILVKFQIQKIGRYTVYGTQKNEK